jgi:hypothetical protein
MLSEFFDIIDTDIEAESWTIKFDLWAKGEVETEFQVYHQLNTSRNKPGSLVCGLISFFDLTIIVLVLLQRSDHLRRS